MNLFKGFFCYLCDRYEKEGGLFTVALIFVALISLFFLGIYFLIYPYLVFYDIDPMSSLRNNSISFKIIGSLITLMITIPIWLFFKKKKGAYLEEFNKLNKEDQSQILKRSKYIFYSFFIYLIITFIIGIFLHKNFEYN